MLLVQAAIDLVVGALPCFLFSLKLRLLIYPPPYLVFGGPCSRILFGLLARFFETADRFFVGPSLGLTGLEALLLLGSDLPKFLKLSLQLFFSGNQPVDVGAGFFLLSL